MKVRVLIFILSSVSLLLGCQFGNPEGIHEIHGNVTYAGAPLTYGEIAFVPDGSKEHSGPVGRAVIVEGEFRTDVGGRGVQPGPHIVKITGYSQKPKLTEGDEQDIEVLTPIFTNYTSEMNLSEGGYRIEIPASVTTASN